MTPAPRSPIDLVLLHGFAATSFTWRTVVDPLSAYGRVIALDRDWDPLPVAIEATGAAIRRQAPAAPVLIGHSAGAELAGVGGRQRCGSRTRRRAGRARHRNRPSARGPVARVAAGIRARRSTARAGGRSPRDGAWPALGLRGHHHAHVRGGGGLPTTLAATRCRRGHVDDVGGEAPAAPRVGPIARHPMPRRQRCERPVVDADRSRLSRGRDLPRLRTPAARGTTRSVRR